MALDTELTLDMLRVQLRWMEREMSALRRLVDQIQESQPQPHRSFASLAGVWKGVVVNDEVFESARLTAPEGI